MKPRRSRRSAASGTRKSVRSRHGRKPVIMAPSGTTTGSHSGTTSVDQDPGHGHAEVRCRLNAMELRLILESISQYHEDLHVKDPSANNTELWQKRGELQKIWGRLSAAGNNLSHPGTKSYAKRS